MTLIRVLFVFLLFYLVSSFSWNPPINSDASISSNPACPGHFDLTVGDVTYPCFGTSTDNVVTEQACPNGLQGIVINGTLTCGVITEYLGVGSMECEFGGFRFLSNTVNTTICYSNLTNFIDSTFVSSPTVTFIMNPGNVTANAILSLFDVGSGGTSLIDHVAANSGFLKQLFGLGAASISTNSSGVYITVPVSISTVNTAGGGISPISSTTSTSVTLKTFTNSSSVGFTTTATTLSATSFVTAYTLPYTGYNPSYFPDCPFATTQADINVCLAGRTIGELTNATNAANVQYFPAMPFRNQTSFSVASGFDLLFQNQEPTFTQIIYVNGEIGDDTVNGGGQFDPYATVDKAISMVPLVSFNQFYTILVSIDVYTVGNISFPPNTNLISYNRFKQTRLNFLPGCRITLSPSWSSFATDHVEAGISGFTINGDVYIDFTTLGAADINSDARFSFSESSILGNVQSFGRGEMDLFHVHNIEMHNGYVGNCNAVHLEYSSSLSSVTLTDNSCFSTNMTYLVIFNIFSIDSNFTIYQSTSIIHADVFLNGYDDNAWAVFYGNASLFVDTYTIPLNFYADPNVTINYTFNSQGGRSCGLNIAYFGTSCLNNADILIAVRLRARLAVTSGAGGVSAIFNTTIPNVIFNEFASISDIFSVAASGTGLINYNVNMFNTSNANCPDGSFRLGTVGGYETCKPFAFTPANLGVSFTTDNFLDFAESGGGLDYIVTFIGQLTFNDSTYFSVFKNPSGTFQVFFRNPVRDISLNAGTNIIVTPGLGVGNFTVATTTTPTFTTMTVNGATTINGVILPSGNSIKFNDTNNNATITMKAPDGLTQSYNLILPTTPGLNGQVLQANGDGSADWIGIRRRIFESCADGAATGAGSTAFNSMIAGTACATGPASKFIAANSIRVGSVFDMIIAGNFSKISSSTVQTQILINSTVIVTSVATNTGPAATNNGFKATARCLFLTAGASASVKCTGDFYYDQMSTIQILSSPSAVTVDTTSVLFFDMKLAYGTGSGSNVFTSTMTGMYIAL